MTVFSAVLGARAADHDREVIGRARGGAERAQLLVEEREQALRVQERLGLLVQVALVRRAAALGHEQELVGVAVVGVELDLRRQVGAGVLLLVHVERRELRVAQVARLVGLEDAARERRLVAAAGPKTCWPFLPITIAVPVSWHIGSTPPAAMLAFLSRSSATNLSLSDASRSSRILRSCARWPGRRKCAMSRIASRASSVSPAGSTFTIGVPSNSAVVTKSLVSMR